MGVSIITAFPQVCNYKCLCYQCGCQPMPDLANDWWSEGFCICIYSNCGLKEFMTTQYCCLGPCELTSPSFKTTTSFPVRKRLLPTS